MSTQEKTAIKRPTNQWINNYFSSSLLKTPGYAFKVNKIKHKLDQNENPYDLPVAIKKKIVEKVVNSAWNYYPSAYNENLQQVIAHRIGVKAENILLAPGSNYHISTLISLLTSHNKKKIIIPHPSFPLYEMHCRYLNLPYEKWLLDDNMQYSLDALPSITPNSLIIIDNPNNPTGAHLSTSQLDDMLTKHHDSYFILDEAYWEYAPDNALSLLSKHANLIILRTTSKALGLSAIRLSYTIASIDLITQLKKLTLPFLVTPLAIECGLELFGNDDTYAIIEKNIKETQTERKRVWDNLQLIQKNANFIAYPSQANFHLLKWHTKDDMDTIAHKLNLHKLTTRNVSVHSKQLKNCLRISIGTPQSNDIVLDTLKASLSV